MVADGHTKAYDDSRADEWNNVRRNIGVYAVDEVEAVVGTAGLGWMNRFMQPGKYLIRFEGNNEETEACSAMETAAERDSMVCVERTEEWKTKTEN